MTHLDLVLDYKSLESIRTKFESLRKALKMDHETFTCGAILTLDYLCEQHGYSVKLIFDQLIQDKKRNEKTN